MDTSPPQKVHSALAERTKLEIAEGRRQSLIHGMREKNRGPYNASRKEIDEYLEWVKGYLAHD